MLYMCFGVLVQKEKLVCVEYFGQILKYILNEKVKK